MGFLAWVFTGFKKPPINFKGNVLLGLSGITRGVLAYAIASSINVET